MNQKADTAVYTAYEEHVNRDPSVGERNLMRAILRTALEDVRKRGDASRHARQYILSNEDFYLYSFKSICAQLNLCPQTIRFRLGLLHRPENNGFSAPVFLGPTDKFTQ